MKASKYGQRPRILGQFNLEASEMCFVQYLPILLPTHSTEVRIPKNLKWVDPIIKETLLDLGDFTRNYIYLTVKHLFVTPSNMGNRPGWHSDGFGTEDINYIWCDKYPTEFCIQNFNITEDCEVSLRQMEEQACLSNLETYGENTLLRLDKYNIHRTPVVGEGYRSFVKISVSKDRYNLKGNAHNYLFDYDWQMAVRSNIRNHPSK